MATSIFDEKLVVPNDDMLDKVLADQKTLWVKLKSHVLDNYKDVNQNWKYYSKKSGWTLVFKIKKRTLFYFIPCDGYFKVFFVYSEKAIDAAKNAHLPEQIMNRILQATKYVEGTSFDIEVKNEQDLDIIFKLIKIKDEV